MENIHLPKKFEAKMREKLGDPGFDEFAEALSRKPEISIRINPAKGENLFNNEKRVPWCDFGRYLEVRPAFVWDPLYHAGAYYAQEASSMLFANVVDFSKDLKVLDLCASPGGKSSLLLSFLSKNSLLVSNELVGKRASVLYENLVKWGCTNNIITNNRVADFAYLKGYFDVVMIDAPCSGEGMFRKDREALEQWSEGLVHQCSMVQKEILTHALGLVKPGGMLIYSTCTYEEAENEENIQWMFQSMGRNMEPAKIPVHKDWGVQTIEIPVEGGRQQEGYYCYPHKLKGEGQFVAAMRVMSNHTFKDNARGGSNAIKLLSGKDAAMLKPYVELGEGEVILQEKEEDIFAFPAALQRELGLYDKMRVLKKGTSLGRLIRQNFIPSHEMVMDGLASETMPRVALNIEQALDFMQRKNLDIKPENTKGWFVYSYEGVDIGLAKNLGDRINNHYPADWRIRKEPKL